MLNLNQLKDLEEIRRGWRENADGTTTIDCECVDDLLTLLGDMAIRNELLRTENEKLRKSLRK